MPLLPKTQPSVEVLHAFSPDQRHVSSPSMVRHYLSPLRDSGHYTSLTARQAAQTDAGDATSGFTGWSRLAKALKGSDETKIKDCKEDIDTLLVFAGLFSAVLTAFVIESYRSLQPDPTTTSLLLLDRIASRLDDIYLHTTPSSSTAQDASEFTPSTAAVTVNALWFFSLVCSLGAASFAMLIKQWLREYLSQEHASPQAYARSRHTRYSDLVQWKVLEISALLPWLLQVSLASFLLGLTIFTMDICKTVGEIVAVWVILWGVSSSLTILAPVVWPRCPYRATLFKGTFDRLHRAHLWWTKASIEVLPRAIAEEESADIDVLVSADAVLGDDELLGTTIRECFQQFRGTLVVDGVRRIIARRMRLLKPVTLGQPTLLRMSRRGALAIADILVDTLRRELDWQSREMGAVRQWYPWMSEAFGHVLRTPGYAAGALGSVLDTLLAQSDSVTQEAMAALPLRHADESFLAGTLRSCMARVGGAEAVAHVRQAILPKHLREKLCSLASFEGRAVWQELEWKTRFAFARILGDALDKEVQTQIKAHGDITCWDPWMMETVVSITALSTATSTFGDLLSCLLVQNPVTTSQVLVAYALNREGSGYGVYCGIGPYLTTEKAMSALIGNMHQWLRDNPRTTKRDSTQLVADLALNPIFLCELFTYIGCRLRTTFTSREGLQASLYDLLTFLSRRIEPQLLGKLHSARAHQAAANCLHLISEYGLAVPDPRSIAPAELIKTLEKAAAPMQPL